MTGIALVLNLGCREAVFCGVVLVEALACFVIEGTCGCCAIGGVAGFCVLAARANGAVLIE